MRTTVCPPHHPPTYAKKKKRNKLRVTELRLNGRALRTASPSPSQLSRRQWHTPALLLFEGTSSFQSAALQLCDSAAPSPRRCTPLLPRPPLPAHAAAPPSRPIPFPSTLPRPECVQSRPAHLTLGRGLPAFAARLPGSVQTTKDTHRLSTGRNSLTGEATRRRRDVPLRRPATQQPFCCVVPVAQRSRRYGRGLFSPRLRHGLVGGAEALPATLSASTRTGLWVRGFRV